MILNVCPKTTVCIVYCWYANFLLVCMNFLIHILFYEFDLYNEFFLINKFELQ